jgi:hypothetical protein
MITANMTTPTAGFLHPTLLSALVEAATDSHTTFSTQEQAMTQGWQDSLTTYLEEEEGLTTAPTPSPPPPTPNSSQTTPIGSQQTLGSELRMIEAALANCRMTRDALSRREAMLRHRQSEIEQQIYSYSLMQEQEVMPVGSEKEVEEETDEQDNDETLYMRDVQRSGQKVAVKVDETLIEKEEKKMEKQPVIIGRKEAVRLALIELHRKTFGYRR